MLSPQLLRLNNDGTVIADGNLALRDAFNQPGEIVENGIDSVLLGAASQRAQEIDTMVVDDVRSFLFGPPSAGGRDLASLNIQRGRDHGLPDYNQTRVDFGLAPVQSFSEITSDPELAAKLEAVYGDVNEIDVWVGALAEDHVAGASVGELTRTVLLDQFERLRSGDRLWYQNTFSGKTLQELENTKLSDVIRRNTEITNLQDNVFFDKSVLYYEAGDGQRGQDIGIVAREDRIDIVNNNTNRVLKSQSLDGLERVMAVGSGSNRNSFTVDIGRLESALPGGVFVFGGAGGGDKLTVKGTRAADQVVLDGRNLTANAQSIEQSEFEKIHILPGRGRDNVQVVDSGGARVVVQGESRFGRGPFGNVAQTPLGGTIRNLVDELQNATQRLRERVTQQRSDARTAAADALDEAAVIASTRGPAAFGTELSSALEHIARDVSQRVRSRGRS
jgi:hypothetical protein